jgi:hypothetical protein
MDQCLTNNGRLENDTISSTLQAKPSAVTTSVGWGLEEECTRKMAILIYPSILQTRFHRLVVTISTTKSIHISYYCCYYNYVVQLTRSGSSFVLFVSSLFFIFTFSFASDWSYRPAFCWRSLSPLTETVWKRAYTLWSIFHLFWAPPFVGRGTRMLMQSNNPPLGSGRASLLDAGTLP